MGFGINNNLNRLFQQGVNATSGLSASQRLGQPTRTQEENAGSAGAFPQFAQQFSGSSSFTPPTDLSQSQRVGGTEGVNTTGVSSPFQLPPASRLGPAQSPSDVQGFDISKPQSADGFYGTANYAGRNSYDAVKAVPNGQRLLIEA